LVSNVFPLSDVMVIRTIDTGRKYRFSWDLLGDIKAGRPSLGPTTRLEAYRLMQFTFRDILEQEFGTVKTDKLFYKAGLLAGKEFYKNTMGAPADLNEFVRKLHQLLIEMSIGILRIEKADPEKGSFVMTVSEDLDCSGLPETGFGVCTYDEGFIAGLMESFTGELFDVKEIDCWCTGDRTCRFAVNRKPR
jgi:predicted hydrocarbon binding protein